MTQAAAQAWAFYTEVARNRSVWTLKDHEGFPMFKNPENKDVIPFWSAQTRVRALQQAVPKFASYEPFEIAWDEFATRWIPSFDQDRIHIGLNWSGSRALGYDRSAADVLTSIQAAIASAAGGASDEP